MTTSFLPELKFELDPVNITAIREKLASLPEGGRLTRIDIQRILVDREAIFALPDVIKTFNPRRLLLVMDPKPMKRACQEVKNLVKEMLAGLGLPLEVMILDPGFDGLVHASVENVDSVCTRIREGTAVISVGSGSITDIAKHSCHLFTQSNGQPVAGFVVVQTANTVTAFTSNMAVLLKDGVKRTFPSRFPDVVISDLQVLADAPLELTRAGIGDMVAKFVCYGDWYLAHCLGVAPTYSEVPLMLMKDLDRLVIPYATEIGQRSLAGIEVLTKALLLSGLGMAVVNETTPLSGFEHVISHVLDMTAEFYGHGVALHGAQVGVASIISAATFEILLHEFDPQKESASLQIPLDEEAYKKITTVFNRVDPSGKMAEECWYDYKEKLASWRAQKETWPVFCSQWKTMIKPKLASLVRRPEEIITALRAVGAPLLFEEMDPPVTEEEGVFAFENANLIRKRTTIADLINFLGWSGRPFTWRVFARVRKALRDVV